MRPTAVDLSAIAMADATHGWAAGTRGMIYRWDGRGSLASVRLAPSVDTFDIHAEGPQLAWLATSQGLIRLESERPVFVEGVPRVAYRAVLADRAGVVWAAGEDGTLARCAAGRCAPVVTPTRATLAALAVGTGDVLWVAGEQFVGLYSQGTWTPLPAPGGADVTALAFTHQGYATTATQAYRWSSGRRDVLGGRRPEHPHLLIVVEKLCDGLSLARIEDRLGRDGVPVDRARHRGGWRRSARRLDRP